MSDSDVAIAKSIAVVAHRGQVDKSGAPYIDHPRRVADRIPAGFVTRIAAAWLHDVLEDTDMTAGDLYAAGLNEAVVEAVVALTHVEGQSRADYYKQVRENWDALEVKRADIADNLDPVRLAKLDDATIVRLVRKYAAALEALGGNE